MKAKLLTSILVIPCSIILFQHSLAQSPDWLWAKAITRTSNFGVHAYSTATDNSGNVYTMGNFYGTVDFDPDSSGLFNMTSAGASDIFISKLDASGSFVWAKQMGGTGFDGGVYMSLAIDNSGNGDVYTAGHFSGTADFDPGTGISNLTSNGFSDIYICKLDSAGNFAWAQGMGSAFSSNSDVVHSISVEQGSGNVYLTGNFVGTVDFDPGVGVFNLTATIGTSSAYDIFILKLNNSGNFAWAKSIGGIGNDYGSSIVFDPASTGNVYVTGYYWDTVDFDPGIGVFKLISAGGFDIFISKYDSSGNLVWANSIGGQDDQFAQSIAFDPAGNGGIYTTGIFEGTTDFDPGTGTFNLTADSLDIFISKLDSAGNFIWTKSIGGVNNDYATSITLNPVSGGNVYYTGYFYGTVDFDPGGGVFNLTSAGSGDLFVSRLDSSGNFIWAKSAGGMSNDYGKSITVHASGNVFVAGGFYSPAITFGSTTLTNAGLGNNEDAFIVKLDTSITTGNNVIENFGKNISLFPNPAGNHLTIAFGRNNNNVEVTITNIAGKIIYASSINNSHEVEVNTNDFINGIYFVQIKSGEFFSTGKFIVTK